MYRTSCFEGRFFTCQRNSASSCWSIPFFTVERKSELEKREKFEGNIVKLFYISSTFEIWFSINEQEIRCNHGCCIVTSKNINTCKMR